MTGLVKAKKYDWKDSNMALFGSDTEHEVKKESAMCEPAWEGCGQEVGLKIWRIVKFQVTHVPKDEYGNFFTGDSYIILNTYHPTEDSEALAYDVHFWIGTRSSQDEYGTAAYKTVEIDTFLDDEAIQHREVQGHESTLFQSYFENIVIMEGGAETGFRHVTPEEYPTRLLRFNGTKRSVTVTEVPCAPTRLRTDDVFILDQGLKIYQWNGSGANKDEKWKAMQFIQKLRDERGGKCEKEVVEEEHVSSEHEFMLALIAEDEDDEDEMDGADVRELYKISDDSGKVQFTPVELTDGQVSRADFISEGDDGVSSDVYVLDNGDACYVWIGKDASQREKRNGLAYAHTHLRGTKHALVPICVIKDGQHNEEFESAIAA